MKEESYFHKNFYYVKLLPQAPSQLTVIFMVLTWNFHTNDFDLQNNLIG